MNTVNEFMDLLKVWTPEKVQALIKSRTEDDVKDALARTGSFTPETLAALLSPSAAKYLEPLEKLSSAWTRQRFGNAVQIFDPLYVSNYCVNGCRYCGFNSKTKDTVRKALTVDEAEAEAKFMASKGIKNILLLCGEDKRYSPPEYFVELTKRIRPLFADVSIEIYECSLDEYKALVAAGVDGMTMFQETYNPTVYKYYHPYGPKAIYPNRLAAYEHAGQAGMTFIGLGSLLGINDWREEGFYLGLHSDYLRKRYWRSSVAISFPRICPAHGGEQPPYPVDDDSLIQLMCALRVQFPDNTFTVSTRERPGFREKLVALAATKISAGSKTTPGGYTEKTSANAQFEITDRRTMPEVLAALRAAGFDPVLKDWDPVYAEAK